MFRMFYPNFPTLDPQIVTNGMWFAAEGLLEGLVQLGAAAPRPFRRRRNRGWRPRTA